VSRPVFYLPDLGGDRLTVAGEEGHHAADVRRLRAGELVRLTDGRGGAVDGVVVEAGRGRLVCEARARSSAPAAVPRLVVLQAVVKGDRGDRAVEQLTEAGADVIVPWLARRSVPVRDAGASARVLARWRGLSRSAAKQSGRVWFPEVSEPVDPAGAARLVAASPAAFLCHHEAEESLFGLALPAAGELVVVIGPEGGITDEEHAAFVVAGARPVRLGPHLLRSATAGVVAVSLLAARCGRWT
jgi:16S rRNA (uracil1498-N3)-methyltransferase